MEFGAKLNVADKPCMASCARYKPGGHIALCEMDGRLLDTLGEAQIHDIDNCLVLCTLGLVK